MKKYIGLKDVIKECCEEFNVPVESFYENTRKRQVVEVRQMIHTVLKERFRWTYQEIANSTEIEGRSCSHTTTMHSVKTVLGYIKVKDEYYVTKYENINKRLDEYYGSDVKTVTIHFPKNEPLDEFVDKFKKRYPDVQIHIN